MTDSIGRKLRVLVVDDEPAVRRTLELSLAANGYEPLSAADGRSAIALAGEAIPDIVVLDLGLPDLDGEDVIASLRQWSSAPIVVLSARRSAGDKISALDLGADDYVTKPFSIEELLARMRAALRRGGGAEDEQPKVVASSGFVVDLAAGLVTGPEGQAIGLTPTEWHVLEVLVRNRGKVVPHRELLQEVWGEAYSTETNYLRIYVAQLRGKLERDPSRPVHIITESGRGYRFSEAD